PLLLLEVAGGLSFCLAGVSFGHPLCLLGVVGCLGGFLGRLAGFADGAAVVAVLAAGGLRSGNPCDPGAMVPFTRVGGWIELGRRDFLAGLLFGRRSVLGGLVGRLVCLAVGRVGRRFGPGRAGLAGVARLACVAGFRLVTRRVIGLGDLADVAAVIAVRAAGPTAVGGLGHGDLAVAVEVRGF